ncbi:hypothetical protein [Methylobacter sp. S3L5C]|uniref:hypothetical protein n=1 Tax=Methylobacter sp. S3L5C TaxID=2839024 RepID=UPI001FAE0AEC|nr:hypothetical protein [Methylobacter sp. S3L5C]UOA08121.1 hypothetical protein KKZ03_18155 [Methylobacter sp. S3L5C]
MITATSTANTAATLREVEDDLFPSNPYNLTIAQAVRLIDRLHSAVIDSNGLTDIDTDYRGMLQEIIRFDWTPDAIKRGVKRGSRIKHGYLNCKRSPRGKNCRILFREQEVIEWFEANIKPELLARSTHALH